MRHVIAIVAHRVVLDRDHAAFEHLFGGGVAVKLSGKKASYRQCIGTSALVHQRLTLLRIAPVANHAEKQRVCPAVDSSPKRLIRTSSDHPDLAAFRALSDVDLTLPDSSQQHQQACHDRMHVHGNGRRESIAAPGASNAVRLERFTNTFPNSEFRNASEHSERTSVDSKDVAGAAP